MGMMWKTSDVMDAVMATCGLRTVPQELASLTSELSTFIRETASRDLRARTAGEHNGVRVDVSKDVEENTLSVHGRLGNCVIVVYGPADDRRFWRLQELSGTTADIRQVVSSILHVIGERKHG